MAESARTPLVAANWKMHKTLGETVDFFAVFTDAVADLGAVEIVVCPPFTALAAAVEATRDSAIRIAAQNVYEEESGAYTGEISLPMLRDLGVEVAVVGHSERRQLFGETDDALARKVPAILAAGLQPILCCGETDAERDDAQTEAVLRRQLEADLADVDPGRLGEVVIAYEPIWAIGTGKTASPEQAQQACAFVRGLVGEMDSGAADRLRVLYGGSVKAGNAPELFAQGDIDGGLVGGASLEAGEFAEICRAGGNGGQ